MNKKAQEFSVTTLVVIVLAIIVLVVLALGFGTGWGNLWSKITGYFSPVNVDSVKQACSVACSTQSTNAYCCQIRDVKFNKDDKAKPMTCNSGKDEMGLESCDAITCGPTSCGSAVCEGDNLQIKEILSTDNAKDTAEEVCGGATKVDSTKKFDTDLKILAPGKTCCKTSTSGSGGTATA